MSIRNSLEDWQVGERADYKEGADIFRVEILEKKIGPLKEIMPRYTKDERRFIKFRLRNLRMGSEFDVYSSLEPLDQSCIIWRLFQEGDYTLMDESYPEIGGKAVSN
jgi:hypothetical protein